MKRLRSLFPMLVLVSVNTVMGVQFNLVAPPEAVAIGAGVRMSLLILNPDATVQTVTLPGVIKASLSELVNRWSVELAASSEGDSVVIGPGSFAVREYLVTLPRQASGALVLEISEPVHARVAIEVRAQPATVAPVTAPLSNFVPPQTMEAAIHRTFAGRFSAHEPIYFIYGDARQRAKFQFSFKYRLLGSAGVVGEQFPALRRLYLGYTQRSLWEINAHSSPFYDTSYMPELMLESQALLDGKSGGGGMHWLGYQVGLKHESNGRTEQFSRSLNTVYFRPGLAFGRLDGLNVILAPRFHAYVADLDDNPRLKDYRGNVEFMAAIGRNDSFALGVTARLGHREHKGSLQANLTIPAKAEFLFDFATYFHIQYWNGYGESLIDYDKSSTAVRAGFSLVR